MVKESPSALYECEVMHHRLTPKVHHFRYRVFYLWLDLEDLEAGRVPSRWLGHNRFNLFSFYDSDHLGGGKGAARERLLAWLQQQKPAFDAGRVHRIRLLTFPRVLGYIFNPVCFFCCFDATDEPLCVVAQVTNTFHEQKLYLVQEQEAEGRFRLMTPKHFYVSPFSDLDLSFDFKIRIPAATLEIHIDDREQQRRVLLSTLSGKRQALTDGRLLWCAVKYPLLTLKVIFLIHWQAMKLWLKKLPVYRKAARPEFQRDVLRPHASIATGQAAPRSSSPSPSTSSSQP